MRRVLATFWALVAAAVLAAGGLSKAVAASPSAAAGIAFLACALALTVTSVLAARILLALSRRS